MYRSVNDPKRISPYDLVGIARMTKRELPIREPMVLPFKSDAPIEVIEAAVKNALEELVEVQSRQ